MKKFKKILAMLLSLCFIGTSFAACADNRTNDSGTTAQKGAVNEIRYLNFKPEIADKYEAIAKEYENETGVKVIIETAANNTYEQTLTAKMATNEAPDIFQINGVRGYSNWSDYCADLKDTEIYNALSDKSMAITSNGGVYGIPYVVEGYGIIYNEEITDKYFALAEKSTDFKSMSDIKNFASLKALCDDMQKNASKLGIEGVFSSTSLKAGEDWRWQTHLANIPVYYEFKNTGKEFTGSENSEISFKYAENYKNIFDLYTTDSVTDKKMLGKKIVDESMAEFATGKSAMVQNGNWAWSQISKVSGNTVKENKIKFLPIYTGIEGEENQGICIGTENFLAINSNSSQEKQKAAADFLYWLYSSEKGKKFIVEDLGFIAPFSTFTESEKPTDPLGAQVVEWMNNDSVQNVPWAFTVFPSQKFKDDFGAALLQYVQGTKSWQDVEKTVVDEWKSESAAL